MDFGELQLDDPPSNVSKERRFSVHDVDSADNEISYGQPDNLAMDASGSAMRIASIDDSETPKQSTRAASVGSDSTNDENDQSGNVFIHENVDNTYDEYAAEPIVDAVEYDAAARGSKEATPEKTTNTDEEYPAHYRHPSLAPNENPASDDEDVDKDHGRYLSTLIHDTAEDDSDYETTPAANEDNDEIQKNVTRLHDYWCHSSSGIAIEDDTDAKVLPDKVDGVTDINHNVKGSVHEINNYTRPFMSKIESNNRWDNVFGHGIISDTHNKYISKENGQFIEWVIEINNMSLAKNERKSSIVIGISSDLLGEINEENTNCAFISAKHGFGFDNLGNVCHDAHDLTNPLRTDSNLQFGSRDVVKLILDYSNSNNWVFYAKVGDIEDEDYKDLSRASRTNKISTVFDKINPGSYRLAVALYSQMDALIIESCKIHGDEHGAFYQELKSYANENKEEEAAQTEEKQHKEEEEEEEEEKVEETTPEDDDYQTVAAPRSIPRKMTVIVHDDSPDAKEAESRPSTTDIPVIEEEEEDDDDDELEEENNEDDDDDDDDDDKKKDSEDDQNNENKTAEMKEFAAQRSFIVHDEEDQAKIEEQSETIETLKKEIAKLKRENEEKQKLIETAAENESHETQKVSQLEKSLSEYREKALLAQQKVTSLERNIAQKEEKQQQEQQQIAQITQLNEENGRLSHELKLARDRLKSLDDKKQEMQSKLNNAIETKMKLIIATSEEIDHYRKLIQQIAQNKLGCQLLSDLQANSSQNNGRNGYY